MQEKPSDTTIAKQVELAVLRLDSLTALGNVLLPAIEQLNEFKLSPSGLIELIETEPALAAQIFRLQQKKAWKEFIFSSISKTVEHLPLRSLREALLSTPVYPAEDEEKRLEFRKQLVRHSVAVGCCARLIAEVSGCGIDAESAYAAGLLHDIGKLALDEVMPRSFIRLVEQARAQAASICDVERKFFGIDHTITGKHLAQKWRLPQEIVTSIWLHHTDTSALPEMVQDSDVAQAVQLADIVARLCSIGQSGSFDSPVVPQQLLERLSITKGHLEQIYQDLSRAVEEKLQALSMDTSGTGFEYSEAIRQSAIQLAQENEHLSAENQKLQIDSSVIGFIKEFVPAGGAACNLAEFSENLVKLWQKYYQTGPVVLYLISEDKKNLTACLAKSLSQAEVSFVSLSADVSLDAQFPQKESLVYDADKSFSRLLEGVDTDFDLSKTKLMPLYFDDKLIAILAFELRHPTSNSRLEERFKPVSMVIAAFLNMAISRNRQENYAEVFSQLIKIPEKKELPVEKIIEKIIERSEPAGEPVSEPVSKDIFETVAEIAGGAAHELNNPLSVISGRAQLLADSEQDPAKKKILLQIKQNSDDVAGIVSDLMKFARPAQPRPARVQIRKLLDDAIRLAAEKTNKKNLGIESVIADGLENIAVDGSQIVEALANILCNSVESYLMKAGPIKVTAEPADAKGYVKIVISDLGCGMDSQTIAKATTPFFSAKPAGRKRGMGLAVANRLIQLNGGSLSISSRPAQGTTVTVLLPAT